MFKTKMKKMKFLSGINAIFALAAVALATTFTSCEKEEFNVNVEPINATASVKANVILIEDGESRVLGDNEVNVTYSPASTFTGNPALAAQAVTVTATYEDVSATLVVNVPALAAGQSVYITPTIVLTKNTPEAEYNVVLDRDEVEATTTSWNTSKPNYTDYWYSTTATWIKKTGLEVSEVNIYTSDLAEVLLIDRLVSNIKQTYVEEKITEEVNVYSHSQTRVTVVYEETIVTYSVYMQETEPSTRAAGDKILLGEIETTEWATTRTVEDNQQIEGHDHAPAGHGHGHGHGGDNAGGGIVVAD